MSHEIMIQSLQLKSKKSTSQIYILSQSYLVFTSCEKQLVNRYTEDGKLRVV